MKHSAFNPEAQHADINRKIVVALERISEVFRSLLWDHAKVIGLSPIQIQLLIFIAYHDEELCNVSHLAQEFNVTKPTVSDAIRVLLKKELIEKEIALTDRRAYSVRLTSAGEVLARKTENFAQPLLHIFSGLDQKESKQFFTTLVKVVAEMNRSGLLPVQRMCFRCQYYLQKENGSYCRLLQSDLADEDIRLDCPEFVEK